MIAQTVRPSPFIQLAKSYWSQAITSHRKKLPISTILIQSKWNATQHNFTTSQQRTTPKSRRYWPRLIWRLASVADVRQPVVRETILQEMPWNPHGTWNCLLPSKLENPDRIEALPWVLSAQMPSTKPFLNTTTEIPPTWAGLRS